MENRTRRKRNVRNSLTIEEARESLLIDRDAIFEACLEQAYLYEKVGEAAVFAASERDQAKGKIQEVRAHKIKEIHENATEKLTVQKTEALVEDSAEYREATTDYLQKRLNAATWQSLKDSYEQRNSMLKKLADFELSRFRGDHTIKDMRATGRKVETNDIRAQLTKQRRTRR